MSIEIGTHAESTANTTLVVGTATLYPRALNPDKAALAEMGIEVEKEPEYLITSKKNGKLYRILSIYLAGKNNVLDESTNKVSGIDLLVELKFIIETQVGTLYIDHTGKWCGEGKQAKLDQATVRRAYPKENQLCDFIKALARVGYGKTCRLNDMQALVVDGDLSELSNLIGQCSAAGHMVKVALGVEKGQYQVVNTNAFAMDNTALLNRYHEEIARQIGYAGEAFYGPIFEDSSVLQTQAALKLRLYNNEEALAYEERKSARKNAALTMAPAGVPAPAYQAAGAAPAYEAPAPYQAPGRTLGGAPIHPNATPAAAPATYQPMRQPQPEPAPIGSDDDNDLPF